MDITTPSVDSTRLRFPLLDLARIVAALAVVFFHWCFVFGVDVPATQFRPWPEFYAWSKYGHLGVQFFFMISGFLVLQSAYSKTVATFIRARAVRLYPAFLACCTLSYLLISVIPNEPHSVSTLLYNLTMLNGVIDPFRGVAPTYIDGSYWTLALEWKFYVLIALLIATWQLSRVERFLWLWLTASCVYFIYPSVWLELLCLVPWNAYFVGGAAFFRGRTQGWTVSRCGLVFAALIFGVMQAGRQSEELTAMYNVEFDRLVSVAWVAAFFALFFLLTNPVIRFNRLARRLLTLAGALSYPIYLLHLRLGAASVRAFWTPGDRFPLLVAMLAALMLAAYVVHWFVERPVWRALHRRPAQVDVAKSNGRIGQR